MAMLISRANGNFTAAATWGTVDNAASSQLTNPSASTNTTTSYVYSSAFTGTNTRVSDGIALFLKRLTTTGTVSVALSDDNGVTATREVTVNASDLPADESWVFFKFGSTLTLDGGTDYKVGVKASSADNALIYRDGTAGNWARMVSTTTTGAPVAGDTMLVVGEWTAAGSSASITVTMDNTATTDFGSNSSAGLPAQTSPGTFNGIQIGQNGVMTWGTSAATNYYLKLSGQLIVWSGGTYNMGTTSTPCPRGSTMYIQFDSTGTTATTTFGLAAFNGATVVMQGLSRTSGKDVVWCRLSADASANATSLTVDIDTGWLDNDQIAVATTTQTATQSELGAMNGAAGASTLTVDGFAGTAGGLASAHSGTSPTQAEVIMLTRSVRISGATSTNTGFTHFAASATADIDWVEFFWLGSSAGGIANNPIVTYTSSSGSLTCHYSACYGSRGFVSFGSFLSNANVTISQNVYWASTTIAPFSINAGTTASNIAFSGNVAISNSASTSFFSLQGHGANQISVTDNIVAGGNSGFVLGGSRYYMNGNTAHSCVNGFVIAETNSTGKQYSFINCSAWRCTTQGFNFDLAFPTLVYCENVTAFGNTTRGFFLRNVGCAYVFNTVFASGDSTFACADGFGFNQPGVSQGLIQVTVNNGTFSSTSGIYRANTNADINIPSGFVSSMLQMQFNNTLFGAATEISNLSALVPAGYIKSSRHDQIKGAFKSWFPYGIVERDTTIYRTAAPSERLTPNNASGKLVSGSRIAAVDDLGTVTISVYVRKSVVGDGAAYNGNQPRLILKANPAAGINSDTVLATMSAAAGSWQQLTGTTAAVDADGALEFVVDCDGTTGWVNVDDWSVA